MDEFEYFSTMDEFEYFSTVVKTHTIIRRFKGSPIICVRFVYYPDRDRIEIVFGGFDQSFRPVTEYACLPSGCGHLWGKWDTLLYSIPIDLQVKIVHYLREKCKWDWTSLPSFKTIIQLNPHFYLAQRVIPFPLSHLASLPSNRHFVRRLINLRDKPQLQRWYFNLAIDATEFWMARLPTLVFCQYTRTDIQRLRTAIAQAIMKRLQDTFLDVVDRDFIGDIADQCKMLSIRPWLPHQSYYLWDDFGKGEWLRKW